MNQCGCKRKGAARISRSGLIVRSPLREFRPTVFQDAQRTDKRKDIWREKKEKALGIVARSTVSVLMAESSVEFFRREHAEYTPRDEQPRAKQAGQGEKRSFVFNEHDGRRISQLSVFPGRRSAKPIVTQRSDEGMNGSNERREPNRSTEKPEHNAKQTDTLGSGSRLEPQVAWDAEPNDEESGQHKRKHAQAKQKPGGCAGCPRLREPNRGLGRDAHKQACGGVQDKKGREAQAQEPQ